MATLDDELMTTLDDAIAAMKRAYDEMLDERDSWKGKADGLQQALDEAVKLLRALMIEINVAMPHKDGD